MKKSKPESIVHRKYNIYCNNKGEVWWDNSDDFDDNGSCWGRFTCREASDWFKRDLKLQVEEAKELAATATADPIQALHMEAAKKLNSMTAKELFDLAVRAGIYTKDGKLTKNYR